MANWFWVLLSLRLLHWTYTAALKLVVFSHECVVSLSASVVPRVLHIDEHLAFVALAVALVFVHVRVLAIADPSEQLCLLGALGVLEGKELALDRVPQVISVRHLVDDLERVSLVDEELLALVRVIHLLGVRAHERVEKRIEIGHVRRSLLLGIGLRSQNSTKALCFLLARAKVRRNLDDDVGRGQVYRRVTDLTHEYRVYVVVLLEV